VVAAAVEFAAVDVAFASYFRAEGVT